MALKVPIAIDKQRDLHPNDRTHKLQSLSDTRWNSQFHAISVVIMASL